MAEDIEEREMRKQITVHNAGDSPEKFRTGDFPTGIEYSQAEKMEIFRQKNYAAVTIEIRAISGRIPFTVLVDDFVLHLTTENTKDNIDVITKKLGNLIPQIKILIEKWTSEMG